ncbi:hypothetical protein [Methylobacterium frigidaeris]|uniref:hypothetical protein n=1 Tax=Methylobacterium frigidaeris TaxID=2038277 RepID=UPI001EDFB4EB|nr:hypothetical protein [Methylobacterium frigidaeris]
MTRTFDLGRDALDAAIEELRAAALLKAGDLDDDIALTDKGWDAVDELWPHGQLPDASATRVVIGSFDGQDEFPVYMAVPVVDLATVVPLGSVLAREIAAASLTCSAWRLLWPPSGEPASRSLVRVDEGQGSVSECLGGAGEGMPIHVSSGMFLSVDPRGRCTEMRRSPAELVFLIAMGAG